MTLLTIAAKRYGANVVQCARCHCAINRFELRMGDFAIGRTPVARGANYEDATPTRATRQEKLPEGTVNKLFNEAKKKEPFRTAL